MLSLAAAVSIVTCADELMGCVVVHGLLEAGAAKVPCTVTVPGDLPVSVPPPIVASAPLDSVHCVFEVTSCVVPSLRCATALNVAVPPILILDGAAATLREFSVREEGLPHPKVRISKEQRHAVQATRVDERRMNYPRLVELRTNADWKQVRSRARLTARVFGHVAVHQLCCSAVVTFASRGSYRQ
jgi:hypothetical protein